MTQQSSRRFFPGAGSGQLRIAGHYVLIRDNEQGNPPNNDGTCYHLEEGFEYSESGRC